MHCAIASEMIDYLAKNSLSQDVGLIVSALGARRTEDAFRFVVGWMAGDGSGVPTPPEDVDCPPLANSIRRMLEIAPRLSEVICISDKDIISYQASVDAGRREAIAAYCARAYVPRMRMSPGLVDPAPKMARGRDGSVVGGDLK